MADAPKLLGTDTLRIAYPKINSAIDNSNEALSTSNNALSEAQKLGNEAKNIANTAETKADSVQEQFNQVVIEGDSSVEAAQARVNTFGGTSTTLNERIRLLERHVNVKMPPFNAKGDGVTDDSQAFKDAVTYANANKVSVYIPNGKYLISQTIDFTNLPRTVESGGEDYSYRLVIKGEDVSKTFLIGAVGLAKMFVYNPSDKTLLRSFTFENLKIRSKEPFDDLNTRANLKVFELLASPFTQFKNIDFLGINEGIHLQSCWFSTFEHITGSRMKRGIFIDGTAPDGTDFGSADACYLNGIRMGGWINEWGLKILGSKATKVLNFDSEAGHTGNAIILQGCHNVEFDTMYFENYASIQPMKIGGNPTINSVGDFSSNITVKNVHMYNLQISIVRLEKGIDGLKFQQVRFLFDYDKISKGLTPIKTQVKTLISFGMAVGPDFGNYFKNISFLENSFYDKSNYGLVFQEGYSTAFVHGNQMYINTSNIPYYTPSFNKGVTVTQLKADQNYTSFFVEETGSYGTLTGVTASITSGNNIATFSDVTNIIPGTYISIGTFERVRVMAKNPTTKQVVLGENATVTLTDAAVTYANPTLRYNYKALYGTTAARPTGVIAGTQYFDSNLQKPIWWNGSVWKDATGTTV